MDTEFEFQHGEKVASTKKSSGGYTKSFPKPLDSEQEKKLIQQCCVYHDPVSRNELIVHNMRLVVHLMKKYLNEGVEFDDLLSIGAIGLIKAIDNFNPDKEIKLTTFASKCITNEILQYLRKRKKIRKEIPFEDVISVDTNGNVLTYEDILSVEEDCFEKIIQKDWNDTILRGALDILTPKEKELIWYRYLDDDMNKKTQKEISDIMGLSQAQISRTETKIRNKLHKHLKNNK